MTVKVFISLPMAGFSDEEILKRRLEIERELKEIIFPNSSVEIIPSFFTDSLLEDVKSPGVFYLGRSLMRLANADVAYFAEGWRHARGCKFEHEICSAYGISMLYERAEELK